MEDGVQPMLQLAPGGYLVRDWGRSNDGFGARDAFFHRVGRDQIRLRDLIGGKAAHLAQRQRDATVQRERGMAAREDQSELIVVQMLFSPRLRFARRSAGGLVEKLAASLVTAQHIDAFETTGGDQPRSRICGDTFDGPLLERDSERLLRGFFGSVEVSEQPDECGENSTRLGAVDALDVLGELTAHALSRSPS